MSEQKQLKTLAPGKVGTTKGQKKSGTLNKTLRSLKTSKGGLGLSRRVKVQRSQDTYWGIDLLDLFDATEGDFLTTLCPNIFKRFYPAITYLKGNKAIHLDITISKSKKQ